MTTLKHAWLASRDLLLALVGLFLAIYTLEWNSVTVTIWICWAILFLLGLVAVLLGSWLLPNKPVAGLHAVEWRVRLLHTTAFVIPFAVVFLFFGWLADQVSDPSGKYLSAAASAFVIGGVSGAFIAPGKDVNWTASFVEKEFKSKFNGLLMGEDDDGNPVKPEGSQAIWPLHEMEHAALYDETYRNEKGELITGWTRKERKARAETLKASIAQGEEKTTAAGSEKKT